MTYNSVSDSKNQDPYEVQRPTIEAIPEELKAHPSWVTWRLENRKGQLTKVPYTPGICVQAHTDDPTTGRSFDAAVKEYEAKSVATGGGVAGIGLILSPAYGIVGTDLDKCCDLKTGSIQPWAQKIIDDLNTYTEISPSGTGVRIFAYGKKPGKRCRTGRIEIYETHRFLTLTGKRLPSAPPEIQHRQKELSDLYFDLFPVSEESNSSGTGERNVSSNDTSQILEVAFRASNGPEVQALWNGKWLGKYTSESEADLSLCSHLAFYIGPDTAKLDEVFRSSPHYQAKDEAHKTKWTDRDDYRMGTLDKAIAKTEFFQWDRFSREEQEAQRIVGQAEPSEYCAEDRPTAAPPKVARLKRSRPFQDANEILAWPDPEWLIDGVLPEGSFAMVYGLPGTFKTFFGLEMALCLAHGLPFLNKFVVSGEKTVAYITPEGTAGIKKRLNSWMKSKGFTTLKNLTINRHAFRLNEWEEIEEVIRQIADSRTRPKVLFIDTLAKNFGAGDENSTKDMNAFVNNIIALADELKMAIVAIHHSGKDVARGARGSIALLGAVDVSIEITRGDGADAIVRCKKQKDAEEFKPFTIRTQPVGQSIVLTYQDGIVDAMKAEITTDHLLPILEALPSEPGMKPGELEANISICRATMYQYLKLGMGQGWIAKEDGLYYATAKGKAKCLSTVQGV